MMHVPRPEEASQTYGLELQRFLTQPYSRHIVGSERLEMVGNVGRW
jgi:hypothetical protein